MFLRITAMHRKSKTALVILSFLFFLISSAFAPLAAGSQASGELKIRVILADFQDAKTGILSKERVREEIFGNVNSLNAFFQQASYGKLRLAGTVYGSYTLPVNQTCETARTVEEAIKAASADTGFSGGNFQETIVLAPFNPSACGWIGYSLGYNNLIAISTQAANWQRVVAHELGHDLGMQHASGYNCGNVALAISGCSADEYGDPYDVMGKAVSGLAEFNAVHREFAGWLDPGNARVVTSSGRFFLEPLENAGSGVKVLKIPRQGREYLYLEYRQPLGFDTGLGMVNQAAYEGAMLYLASEHTGRSYLLNASPQSVLRPHQSFTDPLTGATVSIASVSPQGLVVDVALGRQANKSFSSAPASGSFSPGSVVLDGKTVYLIHGQSKTPFATWQAFLDWGYSSRNLVKGNTSAYSWSGNIVEKTGGNHLAGRWMVYHGTVYYTGQDGLVPVPSWEVFLSNGGSAAALANANAYDIQAIKNNSLLPLMSVKDARVLV